MKYGIDYARSNENMGDLLATMEVSIKDDFAYEERQSLKNLLEDYMKSGSTEYLVLDMKKFDLGIKGPDEASYLYQLIM